MLAGVSRRGTPGRLIALAAAVVLVLAILVGLVRVAGSSRVPLASNGVGIGAVVTAMQKPGDRLCLSPAVAPKGTGSIELWVGYHDQSKPVALSGTVQVVGGPSYAIPSTRVTSVGGYQLFPLSGVIARESRVVVCVVRSGVGPGLDFAGATVIRRAGEVPAALNGTSLGQTEPSLHFYGPGGKAAGGLTRTGAVLDRLSALSPSGFAPWLIGLVLVVLVPASLMLLLWNLVTAPRRSALRVGVLCVVASLGLTFTWATITPLFQGPDEPEHFAYAQRLASTGHRADASKLSTRPSYSKQEETALSVLRNNAVVIDRGARQPWTRLSRDDLNAATKGLPQGDGGGFTESASGHSALYYSLLSPAMHIGGGSLPLQLYLARLTTALLAALIAGLAVWAAAIVVPGRRRVAALAGLAAATLPIAASVGGTLNNDTLVNLVAAAGFVAVLAVLREPRGGTRRFAVLGALVVLLPIAKVSGIGLALAFGGALVVAAVLRRRPREIAAALGAGAAGAVALLVVLAAGAELLVSGQPLTLYNNHPILPGAPGLPPIPRIFYLDYVVQLFFPFIHLNTDLYPTPIPLYRIYVLGTWGGFGWNRFYLPTSLNMLIGAGTVVAVLAGWWALFRERARLAQTKLVFVCVAFTPIIALAFVAVAFVGSGPRGVQPEQGRYLLIALAPVALWFAAVPGAVPAGRWRSLATGAVAGLMCAATLLGLLVASVGWAA